MKQYQYKKGFSLVEVMVALVIFMIIMVGTASLILSTIWATQRAKETTGAYYETQRIIETVNREIQMMPLIADSLMTTPREYQMGMYTVTLELANLPGDLYSARVRKGTARAVWSVGTRTRQVETEAIFLLP